MGRIAPPLTREDICTSLVYKWRREVHKGAARVEFAPVIVEAACSSALTPAVAEKSGVIVVEVNDARVRIPADASAALVAATLKALRA